MKTLIIRGNPDKGGATEKFANLFVEGLKSSCSDFVDVDLARLEIKACSGCYLCASRGKGCAIKDDMSELMDLVDSAEAMVCISPLYFYSMSAQMKSFFDRCFPFVSGYYFDEKSERLRNETNFKIKDKKFASITVGSGRIGGFKALSDTYKTICDSLGFEYAADIRRGESPYFKLGGVKSKRLEKILGAFKRAGEEFGATGEISDDAKRDSELEISESDASYASHSRLYWRRLRGGR